MGSGHHGHDQGLTLGSDRGVTVRSKGFAAQGFRLRRSPSRRTGSGSRLSGVHSDRGHDRTHGVCSRYYVRRLSMLQMQRQGKRAPASTIPRDGNNAQPERNPAHVHRLATRPLRPRSRPRLSDTGAFRISRPVRHRNRSSQFLSTSARTTRRRSRRSRADPCSSGDMANPCTVLASHDRPVALRPDDVPCSERNQRSRLGRNPHRWRMSCTRPDVRLAVSIYW